jgi:hypothetical protein
MYSMSVKRREFMSALAAGVSGMAFNCAPARGQATTPDAEGEDLAKPTPQQLVWQDMELGLFIHFDMLTFTGQMKPRSPADPNIYNPVTLSTDQWLEAGKAMGAKYAVFVAKHCTGFLSWQSNAYPYGVKQTSWRDGKGDVVKDFIASCENFADVVMVPSFPTVSALLGASAGIPTFPCSQPVRPYQSHVHRAKQHAARCKI